MIRPPCKVQISSRSDNEKLSCSSGNKLGNAAQNASLDHAWVRALCSSNLQGRHVDPLYHGCISAPIERIRTDFVVVGAGVAGLRAAIDLAPAGRVLIIAKDSLRESSSEYAQGGIAAASVMTMKLSCTSKTPSSAGDGLCDLEAVRTLVEEAPAAIEQLIEWGTAFDRDGSHLLFAREGAHSRNRVLHAHGDSTGREIVRTLRQHAASFENRYLPEFRCRD